MAWDAADAVDTNHDTFQYRKQAIKLINAEILMLLQKSTVFAFATTFQDTMMRYVFLQRALQARASIDEVRRFLASCFMSDVTSLEQAAFDSPAV